MTEHSGSVSAGPRTWSARIAVFNQDPAHSPVFAPTQAATYAAKLVWEMAVDMAGLPPWPIVRVEVVREDVLDRELHQAQIPELVGTSEVIKLLGVTRQRLHELRTAGRFPLPTLELAAGPIWMRPAIEQFAAERNRRPGRPKTVQDILGEADELQAQLGNLGTG